jgi:hypothetical protein
VSSLFKKPKTPKIEPMPEAPSYADAVEVLHRQMMAPAVGRQGLAQGAVGKGHMDNIKTSARGVVKKDDELTAATALLGGQ